jgi:hypothetical protein
VGFGWDLGGEEANRSEVRGGIGGFAGRTPYVWVSNQYANTGIGFTSLNLPVNVANRVPFVADVHAQPTDVGGAGRQTLNVIDPAYRSPQTLRGNLAYQRELGFWGLTSVAELLFADTVADIAYENLNLVAVGALPDGRPTYVRKNPNLNDVILLSNTSRGGQWTASLAVERSMRNGVGVSASYSRNRSRSVTDGTSSIAASNWAGTQVGSDVNHPPLATSNYQVGNRVVVAAVVPTPIFRGVRGLLSIYYNGQTGQPYVLAFNGDANGDGRPTPGATGNDIIFVPSGPDQVVVVNGTWAQLDAYLSTDASARDARGRIPSRGSGRSPWTNRLDLRYAIGVPLGSRPRFEVSVDLFNVLSLLNDRWGWVWYPNGNGPSTIGYGGIDPQTGKMRYNLAAITAPTFPGTFTRDDLRSRWLAQVGLRASF